MLQRQVSKNELKIIVFIDLVQTRLFAWIGAIDTEWPCLHPKISCVLLYHCDVCFRTVPLCVLSSRRYVSPFILDLLYHGDQYGASDAALWFYCHLVVIGTQVWRGACQWGHCGVNRRSFFVEAHEF